jgi:hypothetical protein
MFTPHYNDELFPSPIAGPAGRGASEDAQVSGDAPILTAIRGDARAELSADQIAEIRRRIRDGVYNAPEVAELVAQRVRSSGDLDRIRE